LRLKRRRPVPLRLRSARRCAQALPRTASMTAVGPGRGQRFGRIGFARCTAPLNWPTARFESGVGQPAIALVSDPDRYAVPAASAERQSFGWRERRYPWTSEYLGQEQEGVCWLDIVAVAVVMRVRTCARREQVAHAHHPADRVVGALADRWHRLRLSGPSPGLTLANAGGRRDR
jgi:hypothetical protein